MTDHYSSDRRDWKGHQFDYAGLLGLSDTEVFPRCLSEPTLQMLLSMTEYIGWQTRYHAEAHLDVEQAIIQNWKNNAVYELMMECGEGTLQLRQSPDNPCQLEYSNDGLEWILAFDYSLCFAQQSNTYNIDLTLTNNGIIGQDIINNYDGIDITSINVNLTFTTYDDGGDENTTDALCMAVASYVRGYLAEWYMRASLALGVDAGVTGLAIWLVPPVGLTLGLLIFLGLGAIALENLNAVQDIAAQNEIICCMFDGLKGEDINTTTFANSISGCTELGGNAGIIKEIMEGDLNNEGNWVLFLDKLGKAVDLADAGVEDCPCNCDVFESFDDA